MIEIDGSFGEGGGQILRTSVALAALTGKSLTLKNIRARRTKPGLQAQHLTSIRAAATLVNAELTGDTLGSSTVTFVPQTPLTSSEWHFDIGTAGATALVAQTVLFPLLHAGGASTVRISGGTHVPMAPTADFLRAVYLPLLQRHGWNVEMTETALGFFPKGNGSLTLRVAPDMPLLPTGFELAERGKLVSLTASITTGDLPTHVADRGITALEKQMKAVGRGIAIQRTEQFSLSPGAAVLVVAECENGRAGFTSLGERGKPIERVAEEAGAAFLTWWKTETTVDEHLADQLALPAALSNGKSVWTTPTITEHLRTVLHIIATFLPVEYTITELPAAKKTKGTRGQVEILGASTRYTPRHASHTCSHGDGLARD